MNPNLKYEVPEKNIAKSSLSTYKIGDTIMLKDTVTSGNVIRIDYPRPINNDTPSEFAQYFIDNASRTGAISSGAVAGLVSAGGKPKASKKKSLDNCTVTELKEKAMRRGVKITGLKKAELIAKLRR